MTFNSIWTIERNILLRKMLKKHKSAKEIVEFFGDSLRHHPRVENIGKGGCLPRFDFIINLSKNRDNKIKYIFDIQDNNYRESRIKIIESIICKIQQFEIKLLENNIYAILWDITKYDNNKPAPLMYSYQVIKKMKADNKSNNEIIGFFMDQECSL